jgi:hypothetical protein
VEEQAMLRYRVLKARRLWPACAGLVLLACAGCARLPPVAAMTVPPIPSGDARVWFYRIYDPTESLGRPLIYMNGAAVGIAELGGAFYRDVPPGWYYITVESVGRDLFQFQYVALIPGQTEYVEIQSLRSWAEGRPGYGRDTFYVAIQPPWRAVPIIARSSFYGGGA